MRKEHIKSNTKFHATHLKLVPLVRFKFNANIYDICIQSQNVKLC